MDGGAWQVTVHGVAKSWTRLGDFTVHPCCCKWMAFFGWIMFHCAFVCVCVCIISFIHPSVSGHLCCFHVLAIVNSAVMNRSYLIVFNELQPTPVLLPRKSHGWRSLEGYSPWGHRVGYNWTTSLSFFLSWKRRGVFCLPLNTLPYQFYVLASLGCHVQFTAKHRPIYFCEGIL